jgi:hypothetical protein
MALDAIKRHVKYKLDEAAASITTQSSFVLVFFF